MNITVITDAPFEPVTLQEVYKHLRLDVEGSPAEHEDDDLLRIYITAAREDVEDSTRRTLVKTVLRASAGGFGRQGNPPQNTQAFTSHTRENRPLRLYIPRPPLIRVLAVEYYDSSNTLQVLDPSAYYITDDQVPELRLPDTSTPPATYARADAVRITYEAGYAPVGSPPETQADYAASVPKDLKHAILLGVQLRYDDLQPADRTSLQLAMGAILQRKRIQLTP